MITDGANTALALHDRRQQVNRQEGSNQCCHHFHRINSFTSPIPLAHAWSGHLWMLVSIATTPELIWD